MGTRERKTREKALAREKILEVATRMFIDEGFEHVSMRKIAREAEYSPAFLYLLFKDKNDLLFSVQEKGFEKFNEIMSKVSAKKKGTDDITARAKAYLDFARQEPNLYELMFSLRSPLEALKEELQWEQGNRAFQELKEKIQELIQKKMIPKNDSEKVALTVWSFLHGLASLEQSGRLSVLGETNLEEASNQALKYFLNHLIMKKPA